ncbi:hypothetical protein JSO54_00490 [Riemerella anatipestifer]|uniref:hypothetical protein n=1 Tax=Riemerella anatipestifer TaxID=34085 RepID=UPI00137529E1|nr:hypothetical protein [Riemerella anatipestifer]
MEQKDYIKKQIDQLGKVLGKLLFDLIGVNQSGKVTDGIAFSSEVLKKELGIDLDKLLSIPNQCFVQILTNEFKFSNESLNYLAEVLFYLSENQSEEMKEKLLEKTLIIYHFLELNEKIYSIERNKMITCIKQKLNK